MNTAPSRLLVLVLLAAAAAAAWTSRPLLPPAETQDLAVAWEMWSSGDVLVPTLNGEPVAGAAPLSLWMMQAGWMFSGPTPLWPRLAGLLAAGLAVLAGLAALAARARGPVSCRDRARASFTVLRVPHRYWYATRLHLGSCISILLL